MFKYTSSVACRVGVALVATVCLASAFAAQSTQASTQWQWRKLADAAPPAAQPGPRERHTLLQPNDFEDLGVLKERLLAFGRRYERIAEPFQ